MPNLLHANSFQENPLTKAILLFDKGKYDEAEPLFKQLLDERPDDFMVNYFYGACRTENGHYTDMDLNYLEKASKEVTPLNIDYYFGIQYHAKNQWEKALAFYKLYQIVASANDQEKVNLGLKMEQCSNKINPFINSETVEETDNADTLVITTTEIAAVSAENIVTNDENLSSAEPNLVDTAATIEIIQPKPAEEVIKFNINSAITYIYVSNFKTAEGEIYFKEGNLKQKELEEVVKETEVLREKYKTSKSRTEKDSIGHQILVLESQTYELNSVVNQLFLQAKSVENGYWQNATTEETENFINKLNAVSREMDNKKTAQSEEFSESPALIIPPVLMKNSETERSTPKPKPSGIIYRIQLGAYSRGIPNNMKPVFNKISVIRKVENYTDDKGVVVYTTGNLTNYDDAVQMQNQIRQEGIKDPIIAAYLNGKRITLEQAKEIEKEK
ncbi:MAG: tetratricopeptide repeat protein [Draconibacterium sp.]|nr:tetratricopeptide repeat protein [Draconibacterium sp.]